METFEKFYESAKVEAEFQEILQEYTPFMPFPASVGDLPRQGSEALTYGAPSILAGTGLGILQSILGKIGPAVSVFFGAKLLGRGVNYILKKNRKRLEKANDEIDFKKNYEKEIKLAEIVEKGETLSDEQIVNLKEELSKQLAEKYPAKEQGMWLSILDKFASFMRTKTGAGLAMISFILI